MKNELNFLRIWHSDTAKIKQRVFAKDEVLIGSDRKTDVRLKGIGGFVARLDFKSHELHLLEENEIKKLSTGSFFQIGNFVFQWETKPIINRRRGIQGGILLLAFSVVLVGLSLPRNDIIECSARAEKIAGGRWGPSSARRSDQAFFRKLQTLKKSFRKALKKSYLTVARAELKEIKDHLSGIRSAEKCGVLRPIDDFEEALSEQITLKFIREKKLVLAAQEVQKFREKYGDDRHRVLRQRIQNEAKTLAFESWKLEKKNPEKAYETKKQVQAICEAVSPNDDCFKDQK